LRPPNRFTINAWVKTTAPTDTSGYEIVSMGDSYGMEITPQGLLSCYFYDGTWRYVATASPNLLDNACHMLTCSYDGLGGVLSACVDNVFRGSANFSSSIAYTLGSNLMVGRSATAPTTFEFRGQIDQVRIYDTMSTPSAVANLYSEFVPPSGGFVIDHHQGVGPVCHHGGEGPIERPRVTRFDGQQIDPQRPRLRLEGAGEAGVAMAGRIDDEGYAGELRQGLLEQLQAFARLFHALRFQPRQVAARPGQALHQALFNDLRADRQPPREWSWSPASAPMPRDSSVSR
jgi:hypothetical protein